jgi:hypothetical protein
MCDVLSVGDVRERLPGGCRGLRREQDEIQYEEGSHEVLLDLGSVAQADAIAGLHLGDSSGRFVLHQKTGVVGNNGDFTEKLTLREVWELRPSD